MSEEKPQNEKKVLGLSRPGRLELRKTVESGQVRQNFSHGRSKTVQVEVKKKRTFKRASSGRMTEVTDPKPEMAMEAATAEVVEEAAAKRTGATIKALTETERAARARALEGARLAEIEERKLREAEEERRRAEAAERAARLAEEKRLAEEEEARRKAAAEAEAAAKAKEAVTKQPETKARRPKPAAAPASDSTPAAADRERARPAAKRRAEDGGAQAPSVPGAKPWKKGEARRLSIGRRGEPQRRRSGKMTVVQALSDEERQRSLASVRRARAREKRAAKGAAADSKKVVREVVLPEAITVQELGSRMAIRGAEVVKVLMKLGVMATINQVLDTDTAELVVAEFGHKAKRVSESDVEIGLGGESDTPETLVARPPVVTVMGHVDHGKTSLLDALRASDVAGGEAGGITQHIGAYQVTMPSGAQITFLDTPGHEAFTQMRSRGAKTTDIVILVVAADDGVMPQTVEAIKHAQAAEAPMIIAINKIDRPDANPDRVRNELLQHNVVVESMGGDVLEVQVSAKEKTNLDKLEEAILLQAEVLELKANPERLAHGAVIESKRDRGRGVVTTILVQRGTLRIGDIVVAGSEWGRVRAVVDDRGRNVTEATPSQPVEVLGLNDTPVAGDDVVVVEDESRAREVTEYRKKRLRDQQAVASARGTVEQLFTKISEGEAQELPLVIKADVHGSLEAILSNIDKLKSDEVTTRVLLSGVGGINESDIALANASRAMVIGFNVRADNPARQAARRDGVDIRYYTIIYELLEDLHGLLSGMLAPALRETTLGYARVKQVFAISKVGKIAGCEVTEGVARRGVRARLLRDDVVIHDGSIAALKRHKDDAREVRAGMECGMAFENYQDIKEGDTIEIYEVEEVARTIGG